MVAAGGLHILGTERHESRRIDNQLRGRAGRQGDPGISRFYLSLEDDLMRIFGAERITGLMERLGMEEGEPIEHRWLTKAIESAQKRVEGHNFDIRKNLLEYDDVMNQQRKTIYKLRRQVLAAGAGVPLVEYDEDPKTKVKIRSEQHRHLAGLPRDGPRRGRGRDRRPDRRPTLPRRTRTTWDLEALEQRGEGALRRRDDVRSASGTPRGASQEQIYKVVEKIYVAARAGVRRGRSTASAQCRYLATIDQLWKDHLLAMDHLRQGIGLRGYGQKDPKQEYKKEGYSGFIQMLAAIKHAVRQPAHAGAAAQTQRRGDRAAAAADRPRRAEADRWTGHAARAGARGARRAAGRARARARRSAATTLPLRQRQEVQEVPRGDEARLAARPRPLRSLAAVGAVGDGQVGLRRQVEDLLRAELDDEVDDVADGEDAQQGAPPPSSSGTWRKRPTLIL